ncbi:methyltransferase domain-containing protein [Oscillospiraceae bacterium HV4-5-C5C]|nr:methyltransferase domain-containing protein [Oscillospiraceae bacterium HV4-5-C5C]
MAANTKAGADWQEAYDWQNEAYDELALIYDRYQQQAGEAAELTQQILSVIARQLKTRQPVCRQMADLGCGTGRLLLTFLNQGFSVLGLDRSPGMLNEAWQLLENAGYEAALPAATQRNPEGQPADPASAPPVFTLALQDISRADTGSFKAGVVCCLLDTVNHLLTGRDLLGLFQSAAGLLAPGGQFFFDVVGLDHFRSLHQQQLFDITEQYAIFWQTEYDDHQALNTADITGFVPAGHAGLWQRFDVTVTERCWSWTELQTALTRAGLKLDSCWTLGQNGTEQLPLSNAQGTNGSSPVFSRRLLSAVLNPAD